MTDDSTLRERKRLAAMRRAQQVALDLFDERGYDRVTVEEVAEAAELSPSSIYRHFGTKEQLVLWDEYDPRILEKVDEELRHHPPTEAVRRAIRAVFSEVFGRDEPLIRRRTRYALEEPGVRAAVALQTEQVTELIAGLLAAHTDRDRNDLEVRVVAGALIGALTGAIRHWHEAGYATPFDEVMDATFEVLGRGLTLE